MLKFTNAVNKKANERLQRKVKKTLKDNKKIVEAKEIVASQENIEDKSEKISKEKMERYLERSKKEPEEIPKNLKWLLVKNVDQAELVKRVENGDHNLLDKNADLETHPISASSLKYILEEFTAFACLGEGHTFTAPIKKTASELVVKKNLFIVYPGGKEDAFIEAMKVFQQYWMEEKGALKSQFTVHFLAVHFDKQPQETIYSEEVKAWISSADLKLLLSQKEKYLLFLTSIGQKKHEGTHFDAMLNLFKDLQSECAKLVSKSAFIDTDRLA